MKKKLLLLIFALVCVLSCAFGFAACGGNKDGHTVHTYDRKSIERQYLKSEATCTQKAVYYYSCKCGKIGEETFEYGKLAEHVFGEYVSDDNATCVRNCTETATCENCTTTRIREIPGTKTQHVFGEFVSDNNATCITNCTETAVCKNCTTTDTREIEDSKIGHSFVIYVSNGDSSCTSNGTETATCEYCTVTDTRETADGKKDHVFKTYVSNKDGSCTKNCTETAKCENCTATDTREIADSKMHEFLTYVPNNDGSCTQNCTETAVCEKCGVTDIREIEDSKVHSYVGKVCEICGAGYVTQGLEYVLNSDRVSYSVKGKGSSTDSEIYIPATYKDLPVTGIVGYAFGTCDLLESIFIGANVTNIGTQVFLGCGLLESITVAESNKNYKSIDGNLYSKDGTVLVRFSAGKAQTSFTIPEGVVSIGDDAFRDCPKLTEITVPKTVTGIGARAFYDCNGLMNITVSKDNMRFRSVGGNLYSKDGTEFILHPTGKTETAFTIADGVKSIADYAFNSCFALTQITMPESVIGIGEGAFFSCVNLTDINIPHGVTSIGTKIFYNCTSLTNVTVPHGVTSIGDYAFFHCEDLVSITLPESVTDIGLGAFGGCSSLETVYFGGSAEDWDRIEIGQSNSSLADAIIHYSKDTHEHIFDVKAAKRGFLKSEATCVMKAVYYYSCKCGEKGETTFEYGELAEHSFVNYVSDNNGSCTANCTETATCEKCGAVDVREIENSKVHSFAEGICTLCGSVYTSKGLTYTLNEDGVSYGLKYSINVTDTEVYIASTYEGLPVTVIKESAFRGANVTRVIIPEGVTAIERIAFSGSTVQSIKIPASIESIDTFAFLTCHSLTDITVDENNAHYKSVNGNLYTKDGKTILQYAIGKEETSFTVPQGVTAIGDWAFFFCKTLTEITLPDGLKSIGDNVFFNCTKLESINIPAGVTSIGECAFINCQSLTSIDIPEGVTTVGERAFTNCLSVTSITIPVSLTAIAKSAFSNCTALENVYYSGAEADWNKIDIADGNNVLTDATVYYYSETQPTEAGNFWHYGENNEITIW